MFTQVYDDLQIEEVEKLGIEIWNEHYIPIIGKAQVDYMLEKYQSKTAIKEQIANGYQYYLIDIEGINIGYLSIIEKNDELFLSKIYLKSSERGKGIGKSSILFLETLALEKNLKKISLTVNKNNTNSIKAYKKTGFENTGSIVTDIENGFVMDDYEMVKAL